MCLGRDFQRVRAATEKALSPQIWCLVQGGCVRRFASVERGWSVSVNQLSGCERLCVRLFLIIYIDLLHWIMDVWCIEEFLTPLQKVIMHYDCVVGLLTTSAVQMTEVPLCL